MLIDIIIVNNIISHDGFVKAADISLLQYVHNM